jgi:hypothetical protein
MANTPYYTKAETEAKLKSNLSRAIQGEYISYATLADAQAVSPKPSDGTLFQVDGAIYMFENGGTKFLRDASINYIKDLIDSNISITSGVTYSEDFEFNFQAEKEYRIILNTEQLIKGSDFVIRTRIATNTRDTIVNWGEIEYISDSEFIFTASQDATSLNLVIISPEDNYNLDLKLRLNIIPTITDLDVIREKANNLQSEFYDYRGVRERFYDESYNSNGAISDLVNYDRLDVLNTTEINAVYLDFPPVFAWGFSGNPSSGTKLGDQLGGLELLRNGFYKLNLSNSCNQLCLVFDASYRDQEVVVFTEKPINQKYNEDPTYGLGAEIANTEITAKGVHDFVIKNNRNYSVIESKSIPKAAGYNTFRMGVLSEIPNSSYLITFFLAKESGSGDDIPSDCYYYIYDKSDLNTIVYEGVFLGNSEINARQFDHFTTVIFNGELYVFCEAIEEATYKRTTYMIKVNNATSFDAPIAINIPGRDYDCLGSMKGFQYDATHLILPMTWRDIDPGNPSLGGDAISDAGFWVVDMSNPTTPTAYAKFMGRTDVKANECSVSFADDGVHLVVNARTNNATRAVRKIDYDQNATGVEDYLGNDRPANNCMEAWIQNENKLLRSSVNPDVIDNTFNRKNLTLWLSLDYGKNLTKLIEYESGDAGYGYSDIIVNEVENKIYCLHEATPAGTNKLKVLDASPVTDVNVF